MSNGAESVFTPVTAVTGEALETARSGLTTFSPVLAAGLAAADPRELADILADLAENAARTLAVRSHEDFCNAMRAWGENLLRLAALALAPLAAAGVVAGDLLEALAIELLRIKFPRLAAMLSLAGAIVEHPGLGSRIDWEKLRDFMLATPELVDETFWDELFGEADMETTGRMPALLAAMLIVAPETLSALNSGQLSIAPLAPPPTSPDASPEWASLRERSSGWVPITFPLRFENGELRIAHFPDLRGSFDPELAVSLLVRSQRRPVSGRHVTDFELWLQPSTDDTAHELRTSAGFVTRLEPGVRVGLGYDGTDGTWNAAVAPRAVSPVPATTNEATLRIFRDTGEGNGRPPDLLFGPAYDTRVVARDVELRVGLREQGEPSVDVVGSVQGFGIVLTNRWFRSLGEPESSLREGLRFDVDLEARLTEGTGFSFAAEGALAVRKQFEWSKTLKVLRLTVHSILFIAPIRADQDHFDTRVEARAHWSATVGPVTLVMDGAGGWVGWWADEPGGPKECIGLLPPTGVGLLLELPAVSGGGFLDFTGGPNDRYGGVLTLTVGPPKGMARWSVTAFGIHELTGSPADAERGRTFVLVIGASFRPGVHLAYGIYWIGAGGIVGINRRADTDALRERLTAGAVGNVLFADDPVRNAPVLLGDLAALFPAKSGTHVFGLTMQLGWIPLKEEYLARLAVGVIVEIATPIALKKVILLGSLRLKVPRLDEKFLDIQVDVVGVFDVDRRTAEIDATIRRGNFLTVFTVTGDGGLRSSWGDKPYLMATLGGFHPDFRPEPAVFPKLQRILFSVDEKKANLPDALELSASAYLAVTSNTIQFGAELTAAIKAGNWKIEGKIGGDALIRLPFYFDVTIKGSVHVKYRGRNLVGVKFKGGLSGPSPVVLRGEVCVSLLLFDACWSDSFELGNPGSLVARAIESLVSVVAEELEKPTNLVVPDADDGLVLLARHDESDRIVASPLGAPIWSQNRIPLGLAVETFEDGKLGSPQRLGVAATVATAAHLDWFSPGSFVELSEAEALALPAFERHQAGIAAPFEVTRSTGVQATVTFEEIRLPSTRRFVDGLVIPGHVLDRMVAVAAPVSIRPRPARFGVVDDRFRVEAGPGTVLAADVSAVAAHLEARGGRGSRQHVADRLVEVTA
jgi:hypothetical protein